jgi:hypothetical protein
MTELDRINLRIPSGKSFNSDTPICGFCRCYDCGRKVRQDQTDRIEVETGSYRAPFWIAWGMARVSRRELVNVCHDCIDDIEADKADARASSTRTTLIILAIIFGIFAVLTSGVVLSLMSMVLR